MNSSPSARVSGRFTAVAAGVGVLAAVAGSAIATAYDRAGPAVFAETLSFACAVSAVAVVGAVIALAVPGNRVGWLLLAAAAAMGAGVAFTEAGVHGVVTAPGSVPGAAYLAAVGPGLQAAGMLVAVVGVPVVVEAVTNTVRHARAVHCRVSIGCAAGGLAVEVTDDGTGLAAAGQPGHGLAIMRERADELGGAVTVKDGSPGVTVQARLPAVTVPAHVPSVPAVPA
jgi:hypothetical protein